LDYINKSVGFFLNELKRKKPIPGGGSVTALTGALACGLMAMVCSFSQSKEEAKKTLKSIEKKSNHRLNKLKELIEEDIRAYKAFSLIIKNKKKDKKRIKKALLKTLKSPLAVLRLMPLLMEDAKELTHLSKDNIISDVAVAASLILACFEGASFNVKINLKVLGDKKLSNTLNKEINGLAKKLAGEKKNILLKVNRRLTKS